MQQLTEQMNEQLCASLISLVLTTLLTIGDADDQPATAAGSQAQSGVRRPGIVRTGLLLALFQARHGAVTETILYTALADARP